MHLGVSKEIIENIDSCMITYLLVDSQIDNLFCELEMTKICQEGFNEWLQVILNLDLLVDVIFDCSTILRDNTEKFQDIIIVLHIDIIECITSFFVKILTRNDFFVY